MTKMPSWPWQARPRASTEVPQQHPACTWDLAVISRSEGGTQEELEEESVKRTTCIYQHLSNQILVGPIMAMNWSGSYFIITHVKENLPNLP